MATRLPTTLPAFFWHFIRRQPVAFAFFFLAPLTVLIEATYIPYVFKQVIDAISTHEGDRNLVVRELTPLLLSGAAAWFGFIAVIRFQNWWQAYVTPRFEAEIRMTMLDDVMGHPYPYFTGQFSGNLATKIGDLPRSLESIRQILCWNGVATFSVIAVTLFMLGTIQPVFAWVMGGWIALQLLLLVFFARRVNLASQVNAEDKSELGGVIVDMLTNISPVKFFARRQYELLYASRIQQQEKASHARMIHRMNWLRLALDVPVTLMLCGMGYYLIDSWREGTVTAGDFVFVFNTSFSVMYHVWFLSEALTGLFREVGVAKQAINVLGQPYTIEDKPGAQRLNVTQGEIRFEDVSFSYRRNNNIFENKNVHIEAGSRVGLVGFSGSGKTTFAHLILRFYDVASGRILIDGQDIASITQDSLHEAIAMIPQDATLFHRTLMENIRYGRLDATDEEVIAAAGKAHCDEFIRRLPDGYQSLVGERGTKLSGGQRQRIAIARAILKGAPILILDEATSALDSVTEKHIQQGLQQVMAGKTVLVVAHRLSTLAEMDRILVFDQGHIIEDGTHDQLLASGGHYARMWQMQAGGFLPERHDAAE